MIEQDNISREVGERIAVDQSRAVYFNRLATSAQFTTFHHAST
jgi:hypothetical protein